MTWKSTKRMRATALRMLAEEKARGSAPAAPEAVEIPDAEEAEDAEPAEPAELAEPDACRADEGRA